MNGNGNGSLSGRGGRWRKGGEEVAKVGDAGEGGIHQSSIAGSQTTERGAPPIQKVAGVAEGGCPISQRRAPFCLT